MSRDRRGETPQGTSSSGAHAHAPIGKTTLTQALPAVPSARHLEGDAVAVVTPGTVQRKTERHAQESPPSAPKQYAVHDMAPLFGLPAKAGGAHVQLSATSPPPAVAPAAPEIGALGVAGAGSSLPHLPQ